MSGISPDIVYKGIRTGMFFIGRMNIPVFFVPYLRLYLREVSIRLRSFRVYLCQTEPVGQRQGLPVDAFAADDIDLFVGIAVV